MSWTRRGRRIPPLSSTTTLASERGVLLRPLGYVLYAMPPACTTDAECDRIAEVMVLLAPLEG